MSEEMSRKIKALRKAKGMTLENVADIVGVGKSTVRKWETGMIANMRRDKIGLLAQALGTTPAYLMGWEDFSEKEKTSTQLNEREELLLELFRKVPEDQQQILIGMIRGALENLK